MQPRPALPRFDRLTDPAPHGRILSNGRLTTLVTGAGSGFTRWDGLALTAWSGDRTADDEGTFVYVRDVADGAVWSIGAQPTRARADLYAASLSPGCITFEREDGDLESVLDIAVARDADVEVRRLRIGNRGDLPRTLEVTAYLEIALHDPGAHAAHPAFSKLFVETSWDDAARALLARRRPFAPGERIPWLAARFGGPGVPSVETDRSRFLGRGRDRSRPRAVERGGALAGTVGSVLDPVFALRRVLTIEPGATGELTLALAAGTGRSAVLQALRAVDDASSWDTLVDGAATLELERLAACGLEPADAELHQELACALVYGASTRAPAGAPDASRGAIVDPSRARAYWRALGLDLPASDDTIGALAHVTTHVEPRDAYPPGPSGVRDRHPSHDAPPTDDSAGEGLCFWNGHGGFSASRDEYVIRVAGGREPEARIPPLPWINVISNERFGVLVSETGAGYTWSRNSRENRLTPWSNDPVSDPHGDALYVRDEVSGRVWSPTPGPAAADEPCEVRHGFGYTRFRRRVEDLDHELTLFVDRDLPVRIAWLRLTNHGSLPRSLSVWSYAHLVLGVLPRESRATVVTGIDEGAGAIVARNPANPDFGTGITFAAILSPAPAESVSFTADRAAFLGRNGSVAAPAAVIAGAPLDGRTGAGLDPCAAFRVPMAIAAGSTVEIAVLLGEVGERDELHRILAGLSEPGALGAALDDVRAGWRHLSSAIQVATPVPELDTLLDGWLAYQTLSCRLWGRSALYQSGGAFGFRDQLQDAFNLVFHSPGVTRAQLLLHAGHQLVEGDVLHWWHPPADRGTRTRIADNRLWLPWVAAGYVDATGDSGVLDEPVPFLAARPLAEGEQETYLQAVPSGEIASLYEHCCRAVDASLGSGVHGLPLIGMGDWNDGFNWVGRGGAGESVWLAFFLVHVIDRFTPLCERRGDPERARRYRVHRDALVAAVEREAWDGAWYRRAWFDDGTVLGTAADDEGRIDALAQSWAVISGAAPRDRAEQALASVERELIVDQPPLVRLVWPPFDRGASEPGYIKAYLPGIRENGGQYTHAALWVVRALAELGHRERAAPLLTRLTPIHHTRDRAATAIYRGEPYVVAADLYGVAPHVGRAGWTWYTGSSGWMIRVALESVLGFRVEAGGTVLVVAPRVPDAWPGYAITWRAEERGTVYEIEVRNPKRRAARVVEATVDGVAAAVVGGAAHIPVVRDGARHRVQVTLGGK